MSSRDDPPAIDRRTRQQADTRARLVGAAQTLFAQQGIDATRINEITEAADVGFGAFYNHFESKSAIVAAVIGTVAAAAGAAIDAATARIEDPAEVVSVAHRTLLQIAADDPEFGWLMVRMEISRDLASAALRGYATRDLARGIKAGRLSVDNVEVALIAAGGALLAITRALLDEQLTAEVACDHAAGVLRLFGLSPDDAREVAHRPMPRISVATPPKRQTRSG